MTTLKWVPTSLHNSTCILLVANMKFHTKRDADNNQNFTLLVAYKVWNDGRRWHQNLPCLSKGTSSSTNGSKSSRCSDINFTTSCRCLRCPLPCPSNWSPRARNRQFLNPYTIFKEKQFALFIFIPQGYSL